MLPKDICAVGFVTIYLFIYCLLLQFESTLQYAMVMLLFSPLAICFMVYVVIKFGRYDGPWLNNNEFGYQDKKHDELGVF